MFIYRFDTKLVSNFLFLFRHSMQLRLEYCSCFFTAGKRPSIFCAYLGTFSVKLFIISFLCSLSCFYISKFLVIKSTASLSSCRCLSPLTCFSFSSFVLSNICVICFSFFIQVNNIVTHSGSFKLSVNKASGISLDVLPLDSWMLPLHWNYYLNLFF